MPSYVPSGIRSYANHQGHRSRTAWYCCVGECTAQSSTVRLSTTQLSRVLAPGVVVYTDQPL